MKTVNALLFGFAFVLAFRVDAPAYAYLDPGTGSMIMQMVLGGIAGALVIGRLYWRRIKGFFGGKPPGRQDQEFSRNSDAK